jgi:hypothetical protein
MDAVSKILRPKKHLFIPYKIKTLWKSDYFWFKVKFALLFPFIFNSKKIKIKIVESFYKRKYMQIWDPGFQHFARIQKIKNNMLWKLNLEW